MEPRISPAPRERAAAPAFAAHLRRATVGAASGAGRAVFYRPPPPGPLSAAAQGTGPFCGDLGMLPGGHRLVFPLPMGYANSYEDTWGAPRPQGGHEGTDLMAPPGTPEYAVTDGTIVSVVGSNGNGWNSLGGYTVMLRAAYSVGPVREGDLFYYAHLEKESALALGATVRAGQVVGYAGDTGQGPEVTRGLFPPHLHFGWYDARGTRSYLPSGAMNPYPLLEWITAGGGVLGGGSAARYCEVPRSGPPIPSAGDDRWPAARDAGARPDLDTGSKRPAPSPVAGKTAAPPEHRSAHAKRAAPTRSQDRHPQETTGKPSPEPRPAAHETPGKPASGEPPPHAAPQAEQSREDGPHAPISTPEQEPTESQQSHHPGEGQEPEGGAGKGEEEEAEDSGGAAEGEKPEAHEPQEEEKPAEDRPPEDGESAPEEGDPSPEAGADEDTESKVPETGSSDEEDAGQETTSSASSAPPETTTPE